MTFFGFDAEPFPDDRPCASVAFPRWLRRDAFEARAAAEGLTIEESVVAVGSEELLRRVPVWILRTADGGDRVFPITLVEHLLGAQPGYLQKLTAISNLRMLPFFMLKDERARYSTVLSFSSDRAANQQLSYEKPMEAYGKILRRLHGLYGHVFCLHLKYDANILTPPPADAKGTINLYINMRPPGDGGEVRRSEIFCLAIGSNVDGWPCATPARGVGTVLNDSAGVPVVQVVGRNAFLFVPLCGSFNPYTSERIFWRLMDAALQGIELESKHVEPHTDPDALADQAREWITNWPKAVEDTIEKSQKEMTDALQLAALKHREVNELRSALVFLRENSLVQETLARMPEDFRRMQSMAQVARIWVADNGVHIETRDVVIERNNRRFLIGPLMIRMSNRASVYVWSENPKGPDQAPHPHVDRLEDPCFGNVGAKITKLLGEHRYADALEVILAWLVRGYSPELTLRKIEQWPEIDAQGNLLPPGPVEVITIEGLEPLRPFFKRLANIGIDLGPLINEPKTETTEDVP